jgi:hypothetical protein
MAYAQTLNGIRTAQGQSFLLSLVFHTQDPAATFQFPEDEDMMPAKSKKQRIPEPDEEDPVEAELDKAEKLLENRR